MNLTSSLMQSEWMKALGWTFVHSLWQIALIGLILFIILRLIPGRSAHMRYTISTLALWSIVIMALSTFILMLPETRELKEISGQVVMFSTPEPLSLTDKVSYWLEARMPMMLTIWWGGVTLLMIRLAFSLGWVRHIRTTTMPDPKIQEVLDQLIRRLKLNVKPGAGESALVNSPVTIGHLKPLILFPVGIINQLSPREVEAILTHELAHIVRRDYLSNLVQSFIETLFYYHPITWWISGMVRSERENRADDLAVRWCGDHLGYAKALMTVQQMQTRQGPALALGFASHKGAMLARIQRILNLPYKNHNQMEKTVLLSLSTLCFLAFTLTSHTSVDAKTEVLLSVPLTSVSRVAFLDESKPDSIPSEGIYRIHKKTDDQDITIEVENGDIKELKVDGKEIDPTAFKNYDALINDLFGAMDAVPSMDGFDFRFPAIPSMPMMPSMPYMIEGFEMPEIPMMPYMIEGFEMPDMPESGWLDSLKGMGFNWSGDMPGDAILKMHGMDNMKFMIDSLPGGNNKIIIINGMDTTILSAQSISWEGSPLFYYKGEGKLSEEDIKRHHEEWQGQAEQWRAQADEWRAHQNQMRDQYRHDADSRRAELELLRDINRNEYRITEESQRAIEQDRKHQQELRSNQRKEQIERELKVIDYLDRLPTRLSLSDQMVQDGLVKPGEEVVVQLTPDKMKINGEKMPEAIHQRYLELYQRQQGIELSGNSKVEFTTKSKQRM